IKNAPNNIIKLLSAFDPHQPLLTRSHVLSLITIIAILIFIVALVGYRHLLTCFSLVLIIIHAFKTSFDYKKNDERQYRKYESLFRK
ncbi:hypothetical protein, partial [Staphylococcus pettenkoferi]|uniref:hypothetical protein n=1 Tax=Staphylococcus pettenkoferi TaxID=170573 RepID=UPI001F583A3A